MSAAAAERAKQAVLAECPKGVPPDVVEYLAETAASLFEDDSNDEQAILADLEENFLPHLEEADLSAEDTAAFCRRVLHAAMPTGGGGGTAAAAAAAPQAATAGSEVEPADCLCRVPNLMLLYGGSSKPLLKNTTLELVRGHRYGVVGANGTGKTTLMAKLAKKEILGFPQDVRVVHLRHEAILRGIGKSTTAREYTQLRNSGETAASEEDLHRALCDVGFEGDDLLEKPVVALSGGWQMRLALACAVAQKANLLLLDEPTNHLDVEAVAWLVDFIQRTCLGGEVGGTAMIVSHDEAFLNQVCTDIVHFTPDAKLVYHSGNFAAFKADALKGDEAKAQQVLEVPKVSLDDDPTRMNPLAGAELDRLVFPAPPDRLPSSAGLGKAIPAVRTISKMSFTYPAADAPVLRDISVSLFAGSRVGIVGKNGSGKSTLLSIIGGRIRPVFGEIWSHSSLRLVYIAQHHETQLGDYLGCTPVDYMQIRFRRDFDPEALPPHLEMKPLTKQQLSKTSQLAKKHGNRGHEVEEILYRQVDGKDGKDVSYGVKWRDLSPRHNSTGVKRSRLKALGQEYLADEYDQRIAAAWGTERPRPLSDRELISHFEDFGLPEEISKKRSISMLSSGQRSKVMLAASFWTRPHIICLDEPTNYLDTDTVKQLTQALRKFRGGYAIVSHSEEFINETCEETWTVADGGVTVSKRDPLQGVAAG